MSNRGDIRSFFGGASSRAALSPRAGSAPKRRRTGPARTIGGAATQMYLDVGQKALGASTCSLCSMVFYKGDRDDDRRHRQFHERFLSGVLLPEPIVRKGMQDSADRCRGKDRGQVVRFGAPWPPKVEQVVEFARAGLGMVAENRSSTAQSQVYVFVSGARRAIGCMIVVPVHIAYLPVFQANDSDLVVSHSAEESSVRMGIDLIWVLSSCRRQAIATKLMDCARSLWSFPETIRKQDLAFSQPTRDGARFARKYVDPEQFLVYGQRLIENT